MTFNSATARSRGETAKHGSFAQRTRHLQFGHGTEPWRNSKARDDLVKALVPSIRPRHGAVEKQARRQRQPPGPMTFNSATARSRGETSLIAHNISLVKLLQFGHGTEPWRNTKKAMG